MRHHPAILQLLAAERQRRRRRWVLFLGVVSTVLYAFIFISQLTTPSDFTTPATFTSVDYTPTDQPHTAQRSHSTAVPLHTVRRMVQHPTAYQSILHQRSGLTSSSASGPTSNSAAVQYHLYAISSARPHHIGSVSSASPQQSAPYSNGKSVYSPSAQRSISAALYIPSAQRAILYQRSGLTSSSASGPTSNSAAVQLPTAKPGRRRGFIDDPDPTTPSDPLASDPFAGDPDPLDPSDPLVTDPFADDPDPYNPADPLATPLGDCTLLLLLLAALYTRKIYKNALFFAYSKFLLYLCRVF